MYVDMIVLHSTEGLKQAFFLTIISSVMKIWKLYKHYWNIAPAGNRKKHLKQ